MSKNFFVFTILTNEKVYCFHVQSVGIAKLNDPLVNLIPYFFFTVITFSTISGTGWFKDYFDFKADHFEYLTLRPIM